MDKPQKRPFLRKTDLVIIGSILLAAVVLLAVFYWRPGGARAEVTVIQGGETTVASYSLAQNETLHIEGAALPVTLEIEGGRIRFVHSVCPDHLCEGFGWLQQQGDEAICLPAGVWVRVVEE